MSVGHWHFLTLHGRFEELGKAVQFIELLYYVVVVYMQGMDLSMFV